MALPDHQLIVIARDDFTFGVLHSRVHELDGLRLHRWAPGLKR